MGRGRRRDAGTCPRPEISVRCGSDGSAVSSEAISLCTSAVHAHEQCGHRRQPHAIQTTPRVVFAAAVLLLPLLPLLLLLLLLLVLVVVVLLLLLLLLLSLSLLLLATSAAACHRCGGGCGYHG